MKNCEKCKIFDSNNPFLIGELCEDCKPIGKAERFNDGKTKWSLVDFESIESLPKVLEFGAKKYSRDNWKKGLDVREVCESLMRHLISFMDGEDNDPESGISHIGHIQCNAMFISYMLKYKPELDTRNKPKNN